MKSITYQIIVRWSEEDASYEAIVPALRGCIAYGDSPEEAVKEVHIAADLWLEAVAKNGKPIPPPDKVRDRIAELAPILNMSAIAREAGISVQTIASKIKRGTPLTEVESGAVSQVLAAHGLA
jgi:predicted RNase H-like HicB family nuclease